MKYVPTITLSLLFLTIVLAIGAAAQRAGEATAPQPPVLLAPAEVKTPNTVPADAAPRSVSVAKTAPAIEPTPAPATNGPYSGEIRPTDEIPGAVSVPMHSGPTLILIPTDPNKPKAEQLDWLYIPIFRVVAVKYDRGQKLLSCRLATDLGAENMDLVFARLAEVTKTPLQKAFRLSPVRCQSLVIELNAFGKKFQLLSEGGGHDIVSGVVPVQYRVNDDELDQLLAADMQNVRVTVRSLHPYTAVTRNLLRAELSITAIRDALEKVLPKGMKMEDLERHPLIVDRDALLQFQQAIREEFRVLVEGNPAQFAGLDRVLDRVLNRLTVSKVAPHEVAGEMIDAVTTWDSKNARLDISPTERSTFTRELEEASERRADFKHAWDTMRQEARKASDHKTWHKTLRDKMNHDARLKVGIGIFSGSASMKLDKEHDESDQGTDQVIRDTFEQMKNAGEMSQETFEKSYRKFKGDAWDRSVAGKVLRLHKVTNLNAHSFRSAVIEQREPMSRGLLEQTTLLPLEPRAATVAISPREFEQLKEKERIAAREAEAQRRKVEALEVASRDQAEAALRQAQALLVAAGRKRDAVQDDVKRAKAAADSATAAVVTAQATYEVKRQQYDTALAKPVHAYRGDPFNLFSPSAEAASAAAAAKAARDEQCRQELERAKSELVAARTAQVDAVNHLTAAVSHVSPAEVAAEKARSDVERAMAELTALRK